ncbi:uncharacterized protein LOC109532875 isoform X6 [Dendroctonus ponderosae]|uniref:uncharacterized protein LOC109532875 isoform X6 n=1 Tax=Dendroctonus ponderosae TaxID=77166 RepID=UPI00203561DA|nr:uncharacterized protein LOC109532875 isoform X6 [Dendroctonus ponderosae]
MFIFSSTFNLLHHFKMRQAFVFTLVIVLISQFNRDQATELLIESAESRLLDLRVAGSTDVHNSSDGPHEICKQLHQDGFQLSMNANGPSIKSLCDGFKNKQEGKCIVGRCECPEERQFCTNNADSKKKFQKPIIYNDPTEQFGKTMKVPTKKSSAYENDSGREHLEEIQFTLYEWQPIVEFSLWLCAAVVFVLLWLSYKFIPNLPIWSVPKIYKVFIISISEIVQHRLLFLYTYLRTSQQLGVLLAFYISVFSLLTAIVYLFALYNS